MQRVVVGMSGGVDSSVAAYLLKQQGYEVIGVTMEMWRDAPEVCSDVTEAREIAEAIGIEHIVMHFKPEFERCVVSDFIEEYLRGRTPNPCVVCNKKIKWEALLRRGRELGAEYVATGHYARVMQLKNGRWTVALSASATKDQTYVLAALTQEQLSHTLMPLGEYEKPMIRQIAAELGLAVAEKQDSQDICFIDDGDYGGFLERRLQQQGRALPPEGDFVLADGTVVGRHKGIIHYTIGQRKGLGIALGKPMFVQRIDVERNEVVLGDDSEVFTDSLVATDMNFVSFAEEDFDFSKEYIGRIRYSHRGTPCRISPEGGASHRYRIDFLDPVRAVTPGQTVVLYDGDYLAAGGTILC